MTQAPLSRLEKAWITVLIEGQSTWVECHHLWRCRGPEGSLTAEDRALLRRYRERIANLRHYLYAHRAIPLEGTGLWYRVITAVMRGTCRGPRWLAASGYSLVTSADQCLNLLGRLCASAQVREILTDHAPESVPAVGTFESDSADVMTGLAPSMSHA